MWDTIIIKPFITALLFIYDLIGENFGLAIILFTVTDQRHYLSSYSQTDQE